jgi:hypothetical protein
MNRLIILIFITLLIGCGGGTTGSASTGGFVEKTFFGQLNDIDGNPLVNAKVEIIETGDSAITDKDGKFRFVATVPVGIIITQITTAAGDRLIIENYVDETTGEVQISTTYKLGVQRKYKNWEFIFSVKGSDCSSAFYGNDLSFYTEDRLEEIIEGLGYDYSTLQQFYDIKQGGNCNINIEILKNGKPVPNLEYSAKVTRCNYNSSMIAPSYSEIPFANGQSDNNGIIDIPFVYEKTGICKYEIIVPEYGNLRLGSVFEIDTAYYSEIRKYDY